MEKEEIIILLQCIEFFTEGLSEEQISKYGFNPRLIRIAYRIYLYLEKDKGILKHGGLNGI